MQNKDKAVEIMSVITSN